MKTQFRIILFWIKANYNQLLIIAYLIFFTAQIIRIIVANAF
jgi:hypothetical protein